MDYLISVVIPCYNSSTTIKSTLNSLVAQTKPVFEVIIIDDFSKDYDVLLATISNYKGKLAIELLRNNENKNGAYSRNRGINVAKGNVVAFLDADDMWVPNKAERINQSIEQFGVDNLFFSRVSISVDNKIIDSRPKHFNPNIHMSEYLFLEDGFIQTSSIFCSTKIAKRILFQEKFRRHQDYDFVLRAAYNKVNFQFIDEELAIYSSDLSVNLSKGEAYSYSKFWANEMRAYFSKSGFKGFQFFNLTARLLAEKRYLKAVFNTIKVFLSFSLPDYKRIFPKFKRILKTTF